MQEVDAGWSDEERFEGPPQIFSAKGIAPAGVTSETGATETKTKQAQGRSAKRSVAHNKEKSVTGATLDGVPRFDVRDDGVYYINGENQIWISSKLEIMAATRDESGDNWGTLLSFTDREKRPHKWAMPSSMLAGSGEDYRRELLRQGLRIAPGAAARNMLTMYIQSQPINKFARCVSVSGWHRCSFVWPDGIVSKSQERTENEQSNDDSK